MGHLGVTADSAYLTSGLPSGTSVEVIMGDYTLADWVGLLGNNHVVELMEGKMGQNGV